MEGAWYARGGSKTRELYTIIHLPYTSMVLSYVLIGAAISPSIYPQRVGLTLLAYFLGLGLSAHALNEIHAKHWGSALSKHELRIIFFLPLTGALAIGAYGMYVLHDHSSGGLVAPLVLLVFIVLETFFLFAYNTELSSGKLHSDLAFAFSWGALPAITSYYVNAVTITLAAILVTLGLATTAGIEINLSRWCKDFRRRNSLSEIRFEDNSRLNLTTAELIAKPETALVLIVAAVDLLAVGLIFVRVF